MYRMVTSRPGVAPGLATAGLNTTASDFQDQVNDYVVIRRADLEKVARILEINMIS